MGTEDKPDVYIQYYDGSWIDITPDARSFRIRDAGLLKIPYATVVLHNPSNAPSDYDLFRIQVDTTGITYMPFYGRVEGRELRPFAGVVNRKDRIITAYGLEKRLKNDTITWKYASEDSAHGALWTFKSIIEDFLDLGDSGYSSNIVLDTDAGNIGYPNPDSYLHWLGRR